jgi:hypothetical protein
MRLGLAQVSDQLRKTVVIVQSNYLPWRGYFDLLSRADEAILYDSVQYTRRDWRNRNQIKTPQGVTWITVPVQTTGRLTQSIDEARVDRGWAEKHMRSIELAYRRSPAFESTAAQLFSTLAEVANEPLLTHINERLLRTIMDWLGIGTPMRRCTAVLGRENMRKMEPSERLIALCCAVGAQRYLSAPAARAYLDQERFAQAGIAVEWMSYDGYPTYPQLWGAFVPNVSIVDLLLNTGQKAPRYLTAV